MVCVVSNEYNQPIRPQFVEKKMIAPYYHQLNTLKQKQGNSVVINTSFNHTTPIVYNVQQAVEFFLKKKYQCLYLTMR